MKEPDKFLFQQPTLSRGASREDLFAPGHFGSWSYSIWSRSDVHMAGKVVFTAIFDELRGSSTWVKVSVSKIMRRTRMGERQVRTWITWLCSHGLVERRQRSGKTSQFRCAHPDDWPPDPNPLALEPWEVDDVLTPAAGRRGSPGDIDITYATDRRGENAEGAQTHAAHRSTPVRSTAGDVCGTPQDLTTDNNGSKNNNSVVGDIVSSLQEENAKALTAIGVTPEAAVMKLAAVVGLTPIKIVLAALEAKKNVPGYVRRMIERGATDPKPGWTAQQIAAAIRRGWLLQLDGHAFDTPGIEVKPFPEGLSIIQDGERIGGIPIARLHELASGPTDEERRGQGHRRGKRQSAESDMDCQELIAAERSERRHYFDLLSLSRRKDLLRRAAIESPVKKPEAMAAFAIALAWGQRNDRVVAGMDEYDEPGKD